MGDNNFNLPPGFRFYPTDEELVVHFLHRKADLLPCHPDVIPDLDLYPIDPWDLDGKAMVEGKKWYFYSRRTKARISESGYWQPIGVEEPIYSSCGKKVGMKKYCAFYIGDPSEGGARTNWIMQEYRLLSSNSTNKSSRKKSSKIDYSKWVVCQVYNEDDDDNSKELSCLDEVLLSMDDDLDEISWHN
ncbi:hypothetical protein CDL12_21290 [Handroanthus impetiginosus]|uniref:NAC domain-containing protein n=1 Tax=Handroanthus impetiginosus TaxID=429701 RepID=A0A2G9GLR7_9LAMI|nr:hypothetical protein CDL12_21290 [Handroanthus impetiginosus]